MLDLDIALLCWYITAHYGTHSVERNTYASFHLLRKLKEPQAAGTLIFSKSNKVLARTLVIFICPYLWKVWYTRFILHVHRLCDHWVYGPIPLEWGIGASMQESGHTWCPLLHCDAQYCITALSVSPTRTRQQMMTANILSSSER